MNQKIKIFKKCILGAVLNLLIMTFMLFAANSVLLAQPPEKMNQEEEIAGAAVGSSFLYAKRWSPYVVGIGIGVLSWIAFLLSDKPLGVSTAYARTSGMIERSMRGSKVEEKAYYKEFVPKIDWEWMLAAGLLLGAFVSAGLSGDFRAEWVPPLWQETFGHTPIMRWITALIGGVLMGIGARWANGCTSGHGISGTLQLVVSSWIAVICFFVSGAATALLIYRVIS